MNLIYRISISQLHHCPSTHRPSKVLNVQNVLKVLNVLNMPIGRIAQGPIAQGPIGQGPIVGLPTLKLLKVLKVLNVLIFLKLIDLLKMPKDPSLACWALFNQKISHVSQIPRATEIRLWELEILYLRANIEITSVTEVSA